MWDSIKNVLELVAEYGATSVFMALFAILYLKSQRRNEKLQDQRLEDSKGAIRALIEAKHALTETVKSTESLEEKVDKIYEEVRKEG